MPRKIGSKIELVSNPSGLPVGIAWHVACDKEIVTTGMIRLSEVSGLRFSSQQHVYSNSDFGTLYIELRNRKTAINVNYALCRDAEVAFKAWSTALEEGKI